MAPATNAATKTTANDTGNILCATAAIGAMGNSAMGAMGAIGAMGATGATGALGAECGGKNPDGQTRFELSKLRSRCAVDELPAHFDGHRILLALQSMARHFRDLVCWQLARNLKNEVTRILKTPIFERNMRFRDNLSDAASSARRNIAEGFGRRGHKEFARFLNISLSSLKEVEDSLMLHLLHLWHPLHP